MENLNTNRNINQNAPIFWERLYQPYGLGIAVFGVAVLAMFICFLLRSMSILVVSPIIFWVVWATFLLCFALFNSVLSLNTKLDMNQYWFKSTSTYTALVIGLGAFSWLFSGLSLREAGTFQFIFIVITFGYLLFLSIARFMRKVVELAQKEDNRWQQRAKKKK
jgi:hypothetical protein